MTIPPTLSFINNFKRSKIFESLCLLLLFLEAEVGAEGVNVKYKILSIKQLKFNLSHDSDLILLKLGFETT